MNATEKQYVEKLKEYIEEILKYKFVIPMDMYDKFESEISALEQQIKEVEVSYPMAFVEWYSGMESEKIERAYQRWIKESKVKPK
jgi:hypothetical protein